MFQSSPEKPVHLELQQLQAFPAYTHISFQIHLQHPTTNARRTLLAGNTSYSGHLSRKEQDKKGVIERCDTSTEAFTVAVGQTTLATL